MSASGWIGVDLDGTLAEYHGWDGGRIGAPVPDMVARVKKWLSEGVTVKIVTARVSVTGRELGTDGVKFIAETIQRIDDWCLRNIGQALPVTASKDFGMYELWDDRCVHVEANTGRILG